jgi:LysM repeat protein
MRWIALLAAACVAAPPQPRTPTSAARAKAVRAPSAPVWTYIVERGDTLDAIARHYGVPLEEVVRRNHIRDPDRIEVGQVLEIALAPARPRADAPPAAPASSRRQRIQAKELARARRDLAHADFEGAARRLQRLRREIRPHEPGVKPMLVALEEISATVHTAYGDQPQAVAAFQRALRLDPGYAPPSASPPKVMRAFQFARQESGLR